MSLYEFARKVKHAILVNSDICLLELSQSAQALNNAINSTNKPIIAFTDVKNEDKDRYFNELLKKLAKHDDVDMAVGKLVSKDELSFQAGFPATEAVLDASLDDSKFMLYPDALMVKTEALRESGIRFDEELKYYRDEVFAMQLTCAIARRLYVPELTFNPKRHFDELYRNNFWAHQRGWYSELLYTVKDKLLAFEGGTMRKGVQRGLLYLLCNCFDVNENAYVKMVFDDVPETLHYLGEVGDFLKSIDPDVLFSKKHRRWTNPKLLYFAKLRNGMEYPTMEMSLNKQKSDANLHCLIDGKKVLVQRFSPTRLYVQNLNYETADDGAALFKMHIRFPTCFPSGTYELYLNNEYGGESHIYQLTETQVLSSCRTYFDQQAYNTILWDVNVPLAKNVIEQSISGYALFEGVKIPLRIAMLDKSMNKLRDDFPESYWAIPSYIVRTRENRIVLQPASEEDKKKAEEAYLNALNNGKGFEKDIARLRRMYWDTLPEFKDKRIWVYYDKAFKGGDNAEFLIRYASKQDDGIDHVFYINPDAADYQRIKNEGIHVLDPHSDEGLMYLLNAEVMFATHVPAYRIPGIKDRHVAYYKDLFHAKNIRLYHGFTLTHDCSYSQPFMDSCGTVVSSRYEHKLYAEPVHGFAENQIINSGMPRHDGVLSNNQRWILFAPTWRPALRGGVGESGATLYNEHFKESKYYQKYNTILHDERLLECARRCNYKIKLYLHPRMAPMTVDFEGNDVFEPIDCTQGTEYADIMSKSDLMITDYSSVMIDFAFSRKPVIYYQDPALPYWRYFDFDYRALGFGEVVESTDEVVKLVCEYMENECALKDFYHKRIDDFFYHDDQNSSERLYNAVRKMIG